MVAAENMQREDLSSVEEVIAIVDLVDAELYDNEEYLGFGDNSTGRVRFLLGKMDSDRRHETDYFAHKFMGNIETIFANLPRRKEWRSFYVNDLPLLSVNEEVTEIAVNNKLNKSQTKSLSNLKKNAPDEVKIVTGR
jgi:hypothetical protein